MIIVMMTVLSPNEMWITMDIYNIPKEKINIKRKNGNSLLVNATFEDEYGGFFEFEEIHTFDPKKYDLSNAKAFISGIDSPFPKLNLKIPCSKMESKRVLDSETKAEEEPNK